MPTDKKPTDSGSLADFSFDNEDTFFGIQDKGETKLANTIKEVKKAEATIDDEDDDNGQVTNLEDEEKNPSASTSEDEIGDFFGQKVKSDPFEEDEDEAEEEEEDDEKEEEEVKKTSKKESEATTKAGSKKVKEETAEETEEEEEVQTQQSDEEFYTQLTTEMIDNGIFQHVKLEKGKKVKLDEFFEFQDQEVEGRLDETFAAFAEDMDDEGKQFIKFKRNGGKSADFFATYNTGLNISEFDAENPAHVQAVLNYHLTTQEKLTDDENELADRLTWLKENGKEKAYATKWFNNLKKQSEEQRAALTVQAEETQKKREEDAKLFTKALTEVLTTTEEAHGIKFTKNDQKILSDYITKPTMKVGKNKFIPKFHADLSAVLKADTDEAKRKLLVIGKILAKNFDLSDLTTTTTTEVTKKIKSKLREAKNNRTPSSTGGGGRKTLADHFS